MRIRGKWLVGAALLAGLGVIAPHVATGVDTPGKGGAEAVSPFRAARESASAPRAPQAVRRNMAILLQEGFTDTTFPPTGWSQYKLQGGGTTQWIRDTAQFYGAPASARRVFGGSADGNRDDWLVTPPLALSSSVLTYFDRGQWMADYVYSGVWISTGSCNPADGAFVQLRETADIPNLAWRALPVEIDLAAYNGQTACLAFRYSGNFAHTWWIDDVVVASTVPAPNVDVSPLSLSASQPADTTTQQALSIGNTGGSDLTWQIEQAPGAVPVKLPPAGKALAAQMAAPLSLIVDDGLGENAIGLTDGGSFVWLNRFTPTAGQYPLSLERVEVMFGYPGGTVGVNVGELVDIYLYEDADGNPANGATHRASLTGQAVQAVDGVTWSVFNLVTPVTFSGPGDILIAVVNRTAGVAAGTFPAVIDQTSTSQVRSWAGFGAGATGNPPVLPPATFGTVDSFGIPGNFMVRGFGQSDSPCSSPADVPWLSVSPGNGTTAAGGSTPVNVGFDSTGLAPGAYLANLCVLCNDPDPGPGNGTELVVVPVELNVTAPATATVTVEVGPGGGGTVAGGGVHTIGDTATVTATPSPGWVFLYWQVGAVQVTTNPYAFEVTGDVTLTAHFEQQATVTVAVGPDGGGTVSGGGPYAIGDMATVTATPAPGWVFLHWQVGAVQVTTNPYTFEVTENVTLTAVFGLLGENIPTLGGVGISLLILLVAGGALVALRRLV
jgi:hypothetical protein